MYSNAKGLSPLTLAFVGDAVFGLLVRTHLAGLQGLPAKMLHQKSVELVSATAQAQFYTQLFDHLTPEEQDLLRRGRNAKPGHIPKSASIEDYHKATGLEALFGYLHLSGQHTRIAEIFDWVIQFTEPSQL